MSIVRQPRSDGFPADFLWGCATASYQVEGSTRADGRGDSIWDSFCRVPGKVYGGMNGDFACDSYRRWEDDVELVRRLGVDSYRFSISWPRIQPDGRGKPLQAGLDYYKRLMDALTGIGVKSAVTIYHWDLPQALEDQGGWPSRDTAYRFAEFADLLFHEFGDRAGSWFTMNEPWCAAFLGYESGTHAPGRKNRQEAYQAVHHLLLGHGLAVKAYRASGLGAPIGIVINPVAVRPATRREEDLQAADRARDQGNVLWLDPLYGRGYPQRLLDAFSVTMPVQAGDMETIAQPIDLLGINYYSESAVEADSTAAQGFRYAPSWREKTDIGWDISPEGLYRLIREICDKWPVKALYITENGAACRDEADASGRVRDPQRIDYMRAHLAACGRAVAEGYPLRGYYAWSLMDNFEWAFGYTKRFGLVFVDPHDGRRLPKDSFWYYRDFVAGHQP